MNKTVQNRKELFGHPIGLYYLFFTELWERFSFYGMRAILVLYLVAKTTGDNPGLGWSNIEALKLYGWYTFLVYLASIPGGFVADKLLGQKKTVMLGGIALCIGHTVLAFENMTAFYLGLVFIILGVGMLKPNISSMVGGLYEQGDLRRDKGFSIFYIGINAGSVLAGLTVGWVAASWGWHYGFGLAGIGMLIGQLVYLKGQRYLQGVGEKVTIAKGNDNQKKIPLTKIEKDRIQVLLLSFLMVIVFWGAFEQQGGLMNLYTDSKIDRWVGSFEIPTGVFQSVNGFFIILLAIPIASFWVWMKRRKKESSSLFKMIIGLIIMAIGFLFMVIASKEAAAEPFGKGLLIWLILAYLFHTIGELCLSPVALSFITKLTPKRYASIMMGTYFAATGLGSYFAGWIGESSQVEPISAEVKEYFVKETEVDGKKVIQATKAHIYAVNDILMMTEYPSGDMLSTAQYSFKADPHQKERLLQALDGATQQEPYTVLVEYDKIQNEDNVKSYKTTFKVLEVENPREKKTFLMIAVFAAAFGLLLMLFLKKLKKLTHGVEEKETLVA